MRIGIWGWLTHDLPRTIGFAVGAGVGLFLWLFVFFGWLPLLIMGFLRRRKRRGGTAMIAVGIVWLILAVSRLCVVLCR